MQMNEADRVFEFAERRFNAPAPGVELPQRRKRELCGVQVGHQHLRFAVFSRLPWELLDTVSRRIVNEVKGVNRILYDVTSKPPATVELE